MDQAILYDLVAAFVFAGYRLPLKISAVAGRCRIGDSGAVALALRCTVGR